VRRHDAQLAAVSKEKAAVKRRVLEMTSLLWSRKKSYCLVALVLTALPLPSFAAETPAESAHQDRHERQDRDETGGHKVEHGKAESVPARENNRRNAPSEASERMDNRIRIGPNLSTSLRHSGQREMRPDVHVQPLQLPAPHRVQTPARNAIGVAIPPPVPANRLSDIGAIPRSANVEVNPTRRAQTPPVLSTASPSRSGAIKGTELMHRGISPSQLGGPAKSAVAYVRMPRVADIDQSPPLA
jgi:hypothetical protein